MKDTDILPGSLLADTAARAKAVLEELDTRRLSAISRALKERHTHPLEDAQRRVAAMEGTIAGVASRAREALQSAGIEPFGIGKGLPPGPLLSIESHHEKLLRRIEAASEAQRQQTQNIIEKLWPTRSEASKN